MNIIATIAIIAFFIYLLNRINRLEQSKGGYHSQWLSINVASALSEYKPFLKMVGIKSGLEGKEYKDWTKKEKDIWGKFPERYTKSMNVKINYLASEDSYLVQPESGNSYLTQRGGINDLVYSRIIAGDETGIDPHIEFLIYERYIDFGGQRKEPAFTVCLEYNDKIFEFDKKDFKILCDFPIFEIKNDEDYKKLGFEVDRHGADDVYKDSFGEMHSIPLMLDYKKNGTTIKRVI